MVCTLLAFLFVIMVASGVVAEHQVPALYVFGDSIVDVGNNNYLGGGANHPPYGVDFPCGGIPTGRFSNGFNAADYVAKLLGFCLSPPPYLSLDYNAPDHLATLKTGVSFASGGSGVLDSTGLGSLNQTQQVKYFSQVRSELITNIGIEATNELLSKSILFICAGGNDVFTFFMSQYIISSSDAQEEQFYAEMGSKFEEHIRELYGLGGRKFGIVNVPATGCVPIARVIGGGSCIENLNELSRGVNHIYNDVFTKLSSSLEGMMYSIGNSYAVLSEIIAHPAENGFKEVKNACCGFVGLCTQNASYCEDRSIYLFWDAVHPTAKGAKDAASAFYYGPLEYASPINYKQLAEASLEPAAHPTSYKQTAEA